MNGEGGTNGGGRAHAGGRSDGGGAANVNLHVERLVLDGLNVASADGAAVEAAFAAELTRLLASGGVSSELASGGALYSLKVGDITVDGAQGPAHLGEQIARAVYEGVGW